MPDNIFEAGVHGIAAIFQLFAFAVERPKATACVLAGCIVTGVAATSFDKLPMARKLRD